MLPDRDWTDLKVWKSDLLALEGGRSQSKFTAMWTEIVQRYSRCDLTFGSDKLIAISGIAKRMGLRMGFDKDDYFAGMWRQDLLRQLLWYSFDPGARSEKYRAPSWSWASIDADLVAIEDEDEDGGDVEVARLIDIRTEHDGNPFGVLKGGYCCIQGPLAHLSLAYASADEQDNDEEPRGEEIASINGGTAFVTTLWEFQADEGFELQMENNRWHRELSNYLVFQLVQSPGRVYGLILEATDIVGQFKRWGLFSSSRDELAVAFRESVQIIYRLEGLPGECCQGLGYTVMIV